MVQIIGLRFGEQTSFFGRRFISKNSTECFGCLWIGGRGLNLSAMPKEDDLVHAQ